MPCTEEYSFVSAVSEGRAEPAILARHQTEYVQRQRDGASSIPCRLFIPTTQARMKEKRKEEERKTHTRNIRYKETCLLGTPGIHLVAVACCKHPPFAATKTYGSPSVVVAARRRREEGRHVAASGEPDIVGGRARGRVRRRLVVAEGRLPAAGEVEDGAVQERQQALHPCAGQRPLSFSLYAQLLSSLPFGPGATAEEDKRGLIKS
jgi:hypothetical protein